MPSLTTVLVPPAATTSPTSTRTSGRTSVAQAEPAVADDNSRRGPTSSAAIAKRRSPAPTPSLSNASKTSSGGGGTPAKASILSSSQTRIDDFIIIQRKKPLSPSLDDVTCPNLLTSSYAREKSDVHDEHKHEAKRPPTTGSETTTTAAASTSSNTFTASSSDNNKLSLRNDNEEVSHNSSHSTAMQHSNSSYLTSVVAVTTTNKAQKRNGKYGTVVEEVEASVSLPNEHFTSSLNFVPVGSDDEILTMLKRCKSTEDMEAQKIQVRSESVVDEVDEAKTLSVFQNERKNQEKGGEDVDSNTEGEKLQGSSSMRKTSSTCIIPVMDCSSSASSSSPSSLSHRIQNRPDSKYNSKKRKIAGPVFDQVEKPTDSGWTVKKRRRRNSSSLSSSPSPPQQTRKSRRNFGSKPLSHVVKLLVSLDSVEEEDDINYDWWIEEDMQIKLKKMPQIPPDYINDGKVTMVGTIQSLSTHLRHCFPWKEEREELWEFTTDKVVHRESPPPINKKEPDIISENLEDCHGKTSRRKRKSRVMDVQDSLAMIGVTEEQQSRKNGGISRRQSSKSSASSTALPITSVGGETLVVLGEKCPSSPPQEIVERETYDESMKEHVWTRGQTKKVSSHRCHPLEEDTKHDNKEQSLVLSSSTVPSGRKKLGTIRHALLENADMDQQNSSFDRKDPPAQQTSSSSIYPPYPRETILNPTEIEIAWLGEESMLCLNSNAFQWDFITEHASPQLKSAIEDANLTKIDRKLRKMIRRNATEAFQKQRLKVREALNRGFRREVMQTIISQYPDPEDMCRNELDETANVVMGQNIRKSLNSDSSRLSSWTKDEILNSLEIEIAWLGEESMLCLNSNDFRCDFIAKHASSRLMSFMQERDWKNQNQKMMAMVRENEDVKVAFQKKRLEVRDALKRGFRRDEMRAIILQYLEARRNEKNDIEGNGNGLVSQNTDTTPVYDSSLEMSSSKEDVLNPIEIEIAWLGEESMLRMNSSTFQWDFIVKHASSRLKIAMEERNLMNQDTKLRTMIRRSDKVQRAFQKKRLEVRETLQRELRHSGQSNASSLPTLNTPNAQSTSDKQDHQLNETRSEKPSAQQTLPYPHDPLETVLNPSEIEIAWLGEESMLCLDSNFFQWDFVVKHASYKLKSLMKEKDLMNRDKKLRIMVREGKEVREAFEKKRLEVREALQRGFRRDIMREVIRDYMQARKTGKGQAHQSAAISQNVHGIQEIDVKSSVLNKEEEELAWLVEESIFANPASNTIDFGFIRRNASQFLQKILKDKDVLNGMNGTRMLPRLVRFYDPYVKGEFEAKREFVKRALINGYRREVTKDELPEISDSTYLSHCLKIPNSYSKSSGSGAALSDIKSACNKRVPASTLNETETELAYLLEESCHFLVDDDLNSPQRWDFIRQYASVALGELMDESAAKEDGVALGEVRLNSLVRLKNRQIGEEFNKKRKAVRRALKEGRIRKTVNKVASRDKPKTQNRMPVKQATSNRVTTYVEEEIAWLREEYEFYAGVQRYDWRYIEEKASSCLKKAMYDAKVLSIFSPSCSILRRMVRLHDPLVRKSFEKMRADIKRALMRGFRRNPDKAILPVIPERYLERRYALQSSFVLQDVGGTIAQSAKLNWVELEVARLIEESAFQSRGGNVDWIYIERNASPELLKIMDERKVLADCESRYSRLHRLVRLKNPYTKIAFYEKRMEIGRELQRGLKQNRQAIVLAESLLARFAEDDSFAISSEATFSVNGRIFMYFRHPHNFESFVKGMNPFKRGETVHVYELYSGQGSGTFLSGTLLGCGGIRNGRDSPFLLCSIMFDSGDIETGVDFRCVLSEDEYKSIQGECREV